MGKAVTTAMRSAEEETSINNALKEQLVAPDGWYGVGVSKAAAFFYAFRSPPRSDDRTRRP